MSDWLQNLFDELDECESLKKHIKEQALHGKCLALNSKDTQRLSDLISDYRDAPKPNDKE